VPTDTTSAQPPDPILTGPDAARRLLLLSDLQTALAGLGIRSVLARTHRIVLRPPAAQCDPSGQVNPRLHIFTPAGTAIATTDGTAYHPRQRPRLPRSRPRRRSHPHPRPRRRSHGSRALTARTAMTTDNTTPTPTPTPGNPAIGRRRLAAELRQWREQAGLTISQAAGKLEWSAAKISRIENARVTVLPRDVKLLLGIYGAHDNDERERLLGLSRQSRQKAGGTTTASLSRTGSSPTPPSKPTQRSCAATTPNLSPPCSRPRPTATPSATSRPARTATS